MFTSFTVFRNYRLLDCPNFAGMDTFKKFQLAVWSAYMEKQEDWPYLLRNPSPANLRDYSLVRLNEGEGLSIYDLLVFKEFFRLSPKDVDLENAIRKVDIDLFRPLQNFIKTNTAKPDERIVKMLAVLIDFHPRPYQRKDWLANGHTAQPISPARENISHTLQLDQHNKQQATAAPLTAMPASTDEPSLKYNCHNRRQQKITQLLLIGLLALYLPLAGAYFINQKDFMPRNETAYFRKNGLLGNSDIPLAREKLLYIHEITRIDTLEGKDSGRICYSKVNQEVTMFSSTAHYPDSTNCSLKSTVAHIVYTQALLKTTEEKNTRVDSLNKITNKP